MKKINLKMKTEGAKTEILGNGISQIPYEGLKAIGNVFKEGELKYGKNNWKQGLADTAYQEERLEHAIRHLMLYANGDRLEDHLAKVGWFVVTQIWIRENE